MRAPAEVRTPEGREVLVTPPVSGRLHPPANGALPRTGERVEQSAVLAEIEPLLGAVDRAEMQKLELEFDLEGLRVVRAASEAAVRLDFARRERDRIARLRERGLGTAQELEGAERALAVAASEDEGARATKAYLDERASVRARFGTGANARFPVLAPIGGAVIEAARVAGETLGAGDALVRLRDTSRVWIEGRVSEFDLHLFGPGATAVATFVGLPERRIEVGPDTGGLVLLPTVDAQSRTARVRCEVANADGALRTGMMAELAIAAEEVAAAVAVPEAAIVMDQGFATAYVMLEGELFQKRELELGVKDGGWVEVRRGIAPGERVATRGAYIVRLAALSPASFGAGHQH
ncbi:MAG: efflux RND transporter periplasmic adaptor subunit [Planctomycetes bacterium]|nr:efflux RND transporter periplasmic adaptor subunit [Planctomycetota bacterium]